MAGRERRKLDAPAAEERVAGNEQSVGPVSQEGAKAASISLLVLALRNCV
jgi:hypothetical protein